MECFSCNGYSSFLNPFDRRWQKNADFSADKEKEWRERPVELDEWSLSNNAIRGELKELHGTLVALEGVKLQLWQQTALQGAWALHKEHVTSNFKNKDEVMTPFLRERINLDGRMRQGRQEITQVVDVLDQKMAALDSSVNLQDLADAFQTYQTGLLTHLGYEETTELLLMRFFFAPLEVKPIVDQLVKFTSPAGLGGLIFYAGDDNFFKFMSQEGISSFWWHWDLKSRRNHFEQNFVKSLAAVSHGGPCNACVC